MSEQKESSLHKEFELERIILFSDAVFAIAITLLIIEIKFPELPENYKESLSLLKMFRPTIVHLFGFLISFIAIGFSWARHLSTCRFLQGYDTGLIVRNLLSLLFIVAFPFSAEGLTHLRPSFMFPFVIYVGNIMAIMVSHFILTHYIFKTKPQLSIPGHEAQKNYIYETSKATALGTAFAFVIVLAVGIATNFDEDSVGLSAIAFVPMAIFMRKTKSKYKPKKEVVA